ncbi:MAG: class I SAM-dependent DNA methyltransferase [Deltaproteobacteria bacterium]|nr:class I SAM-dependent DNA methyltransferase [Deltaproteobacteria bacterium]
MTRDDAWQEGLYRRLQIFVDEWRYFEGLEQTGAQHFLLKLLEIYDVNPKPGTFFEQHPIKVPSKKATRQASLFATDSAASYTTQRMDLYLAKVCVWEMKSPSEDLQKHHDQLLGYWARVRTRYMVLSNFREIWIYDTHEEHGQLQPKLRIPLTDLPAHADALLFLRGEDPDLSTRSERVTAEVASVLGRIVRESLRSSTDPARDREKISKFVLQCVFSMFAEDTELIPPKLFTLAVQRADHEGRLDPLWHLFEDFARQDGKRNPLVPYVDGPLFDGSVAKVSLTEGQIHDIHCAARDFDWRDVRPEIFGSIFEQALDAAERHELGAHYTREADIQHVVWPTIITPWQQRIAALRFPKDAERCIEEMRRYHVLDPACGCGNFLYIVYREMKRLEAALAQKWIALQRKVAKRRADIRPAPDRPYFTIHQLHGIERDAFAAFLAKVVLWTGEHLAKQELGLDEETLPLKSLSQTIRCADALFTEWPRPEGELAIVSNPPYLGVRKLRRELGDAYVDELFARFPKNRAADYVTYWFPKALEVLRPQERAGYVCTNSIAQNESREASIDQLLEKGGTITDAWKSYPWPGEAAVHVSIVNWVMGPYEGLLALDGAEARSISPGLTASEDATAAARLEANRGICFMGVTPGNNEFVLTDEQREEIIAADPTSAAVIRPFLVGRDVNREIDQQPTRWIIDFGSMSKDEAERYPGAMRHVRKHVYPVRKQNPREKDFKNWWQFWRASPNLREALKGMKHAVVVPCVSPRLIVSRQPTATCFDHQLMVIALPNRYHFGVLQSRLHSIWAWTRGSTLKGDLRYTNTTIFETFPFPLLPDGSYDPRDRPKSALADRVAAAAETFDKLRLAACKKHQLGLTKLHNKLDAGELPELQEAYEAMNDAVTASYGFPAAVWRDEGQALKLLLELNQKVAALGRAAELG